MNLALPQLNVPGLVDSPWDPVPFWRRAWGKSCGGMGGGMGVGSVVDMQNEWKFFLKEKKVIHIRGKGNYEFFRKNHNL